ncbi:MAG: hypothetical protein B6D65_01245 [candidate division Zixibacteria bacterium 4484_93]|nr:MAG: hypothetical protein B6D65_01245 [candidate division Zixibacteria bacterium 4484_93]
MKRLLLTGSSGLLGSCILQRLEGEFELLAPSRDRMDITDAAAVSKLVRGFSPEWIVHLAAFTDMDRAEAEKEKARFVNLTGTENLVEAAKSIGAKLLFASTNYIFGGEGNSPYKPYDPPCPVNYYGYTKYLAEVKGKEILGEDFIIARFGWGIWKSKRSVKLINRLPDIVREGKPLKLADDNLQSISYAPDIAEGIRVIIERGLTGIFHLVNEGEATSYELVKFLLSRMGYDNYPVEKVGLDSISFPARRQKYGVLAITPPVVLRPWQKAIEDFAKRMREN